MKKLTNQQITEAFETMPGGANGFCKTWGYLDFAEALFEAQKAANSTVESTEESGLKGAPSTKPNRWLEEGEKDPHGTTYDKERATLTLGHFTDDELANGVYLNADQPLDIKRTLARDPEYHPPIAWLTAAKERIRWLSRALIRKAKYASDLRVALALTVQKLEDLNKHFYRDSEWMEVTVGKAALAILDDDVICTCGAKDGEPHAENCQVTQYVREKFRQSGEDAQA
jgi:hypothetical protein